MTEYKELELKQIRSLIIQGLKNYRNNKPLWGGALQTSSLIIEAKMLAVKLDLKPPYTESDVSKIPISEKEHARAREVITSLITQGVLAWGISESQHVPPWFSITEFGEKVLDSDIIPPYDPDGFLKAFKEKVPDANDLVIKYLTESVETLRHNCFLSSSVMLGVASEAAFHDLFNQLKKTLTSPQKQSKFQKLENDISLKNKFDSTLNEINQLRKLLPPKLQENITTHLEGIFTLIRNQRNDTGHPTGKDVSRDEIFAYQLLFVMYCKDIYELTKWLTDNPLWEASLLPTA